MNYSFDFKLPGRISETAVFEHSETHISTGRANWESNYTIPVWEETTGFPGSSDGKESACNAGDLDSIPSW